MSNVDIDIGIFDLEPAEPDTFTTEPIPMMNLVDVTVEGPLVKHHVLNWISRKNTNSRTHDSTLNKFQNKTIIFCQ